MSESPKLIVCIDDDKNMLALNRTLLEATGKFKVRGFTEGADALAQIKSLKPDMILLDMVMPGMDGIAVLKALKADPGTNAIPVIFMTTQKSGADIKKYLDMGALSIITKPIDIEDFPQQMNLLSTIINE